MPTWLKNIGKWGLALISVTFVIGLIGVAVFPDINVEASAQSSGAWSSILVIIALVITLLKQIITFIGFLTMAIKIILVIAFVGVLLGVGIMIFRAMKSKRKPSD